MYKQVIVVRSDLKMGKGKIAAQCAHASVSALDKAKDTIIKKWKEDGQKKVVVKVKSEEEILIIKKECAKSGLPCAMIKDAGRTQLEPGTITAIAIGPDEDEKINKVTGHLKIL
ncbi:peptidyl-tRNA hydrolase [archaeon]|nr:peptidyl-tRNA hydrolase [archaeon]